MNFLLNNPNRLVCVLPGVILLIPYSCHDQCTYTQASQCHTVGEFRTKKETKYSSYSCFGVLSKKKPKIPLNIFEKVSTNVMEVVDGQHVSIRLITPPPGPCQRVTLAT